MPSLPARKLTRLDDIVAQYKDTGEVASQDMTWLLGELERYRNMLADCRRHRDRAERNEKRLLGVYVQIRDLLSDEDEEVP